MRRSLNRSSAHISQFPLLRMPGSTTTRGRHVPRDIDTFRVASCGTENISPPQTCLAQIRAFLIVLGYTAGGSLIFYTFTTYMKKYLINTAHMNDRTVNIVMAAVLCTYMIMQPLFGAFSDRFGRKTFMLLFGGLATVFNVPLLYAIGDVSSPYAAYILIILALAIVSFYTSISGLVKAEMFPPEVRAMSVGLAYAIANAIFGGSANTWRSCSRITDRSLLLVCDLDVRNCFCRINHHAASESEGLWYRNLVRVRLTSIIGSLTHPAMSALQSLTRANRTWLKTWDSANAPKLRALA